MNRNTHIELLSEAAPVHDYELLAETVAPPARALLAEIIATPVPSAHQATRANRPARPRARRWIAIPTLAATATAIAAAALITSGGHGTASAGAATLKKAANVARRQTPLTPGLGQYVYTKSISAYTATTVPGDGAASYTVLVPHVREVWLGPKGGRLYETSGTPRFLSDHDRAAWNAAGQPPLTTPPAVTKLAPTPALALPSDPDTLYATLEKEASATDNPVNLEMFALVGDSLRETSATPAQRAALYEVAARIPGVELLGSVVDSAHRTGLAVALSDHGFRSTLIFDPSTSALLAEEDVAMPGNQDGYASGTRIGYSTYLVQKTVNSDSATS